jgi:hypothetical protein
MPLKDDLLAKAKLKRTRSNLELIQDLLAEARESADNATETISALYSTRQALQELDGALDCDDNPFLSFAPDLREMTQRFLEEMPSDETENIDDLITDAEGYAEEYESCLDDSSYAREDREGVWDSLQTALQDIADAIS